MRKIAFWRTVADAYRFLFSHAVDFVKILAPWFVFIAVLLLLMALIGGAMALVVGLVGVVLFSVGGAVYFCVAWTRIILLDEPTRFDHIFGRREWRYLGISIVAGLAVTAVMTVAVVTVPLFATPLVRAFGKAGWIAYIVPCALGVAAIWVGMRLTLALPAAAVDEESGLFARAWRRSQGNAGRLFWGTFVCALPFAIVQNVLTRLVGPFQPGTSGLRMIGPGLVNIVVSFLETGAIIGFIAFAYHRLAGEEAAGESPPPPASAEPEPPRPLASLPGTEPRPTFGRRRD